jgi:hypothetical protein
VIQTIREILLTQYIGAILVALLALQAIGVFLSTLIGKSLQYWQLLRNRSLMDGPMPPFQWLSLVSPLLLIFLYLAASYSLAWWLFRTSSPIPDADHVELNDQAISNNPDA